MAEVRMLRTLDGVKYTRERAERDNWSDYGKQAQADVDFLLALVEKLSAAIEGESAVYQVGYEDALRDVRSGAVSVDSAP